jgi:hypothetical protein
MLQLKKEWATHKLFHFQIFKPSITMQERKRERERERERKSERKMWYSIFCQMCLYKHLLIIFGWFFFASYCWPYINMYLVGNDKTGIVFSFWNLIRTIQQTTTLFLCIFWNINYLVSIYLITDIIRILLIIGYFQLLLFI